MTKSPPSIFDISSETKKFIDSFAINFDKYLQELGSNLSRNSDQLFLATSANNLNTDKIDRSKILPLLAFQNGETDVIEGLINANQISLEDKLSGLDIALKKKKQHKDDCFDKIIQKLSTCDDLIIKVCEVANLEYFNALTDNGKRTLTQRQISQIIDHKDSEGTQIFNSNFIKKNSDFVKAMVKAGMQNSLTVTDEYKTALHKAIIDQDLDLANILIQAGGKDLLNAQDKDGRTALHYACIKGNLDLANALIQAGGKDLLNAKDINGNTALDYACIKGNLDLANALIQAGGKDLLNAQDKDGRTALHHTCIKGNFDLANALIQAGGKDLLNAQDKDGRTALHEACLNYNPLSPKNKIFIENLIENPDLKFCKDYQSAPYNASDHITNQISTVENLAISKIFEKKTKEKVNKLYFSDTALRQNLLVMTILYDFKSDKDSDKIKKQIKNLDQPSRELIFKYPIDQELIEKETKLIAELKQIRTKLINKEKGIDSASITKSKNNPSSKTRPVSCWSVLSLFRFSSSSHSRT